MGRRASVGWGKCPAFQKAGPSLLSHGSHVSTPTHINTHLTHTHKHAHPHRNTYTRSETHILNHSQTQNHAHSHKEYVYTDTNILIHGKSRSHAHMCTHIHTVWCVPGPEPRYPAQCVLQLGLHAAGRTNREQVLDTVAGQHYSGPGPWHPALPDRFLSGCQAAGREGSTR